MTVLSIAQVAQQAGVSRDLVDRLVSPIRWGRPVDAVLELVRALGYTRPSPEDRIRGDDPSIFELMQVGSRFLDR